MAKTDSGAQGPLLYIMLIIIGVVAGSAGVYIFMSGGESPSGQPEEGARGEARKVLYWRAPMDPSYVRDEPGKSPMGMDLVPVYADDTGRTEPGTVSIDPVTSQNMGVRTERVERKRLTREVRTVGRVDYDEKRVHHVNTKIEGWVEKLYVDFTGKDVKKEDYLLEIYSPRLVATQEEFLLAKSYEDDAGPSGAAPGSSSVLELAKRRLELWDVPAHQIKELEESGLIMKTLHIHSPAAGIVISKNVSEGMFVKPGMTLYTIADLSKVWVYADIYEYELSWISEGQEADMTLEAYPGRVFKGKVAFINPFMERETRTLKVRLEFDNLKGELKPDMFANVTLKSVRDTTSVAVPSEAVLLSGERSVVVVARGKGKFAPREVTLGAEAGGYYEVLSGLEEGDEVVTSAHFLIDSESRLKEAISKMLEVNAERDEVTPGETMDHGAMDHNMMDHKDMTPTASEEKVMDHEMMENGPVKHKEMKEGATEEGSHKSMDHSTGHAH